MNWQVNWPEIRDLLSKYFLYVPDTYKVRKIKRSDKKLYEQDAENCWLFGSMNNHTLIHNVVVDKYIVKNYVKNRLGINVDSWFPTITWCNVVCDITNDWKITYWFNMKTRKQLFYDLLINWYSLIICFAVNDKTKKDILDNDIIDEAITWTPNHVVNIYYNRETRRIGVLWNWGDNPMSDFEVPIPVFLKSIDKFGIEPNALFIDYKDWILPK